MADFFSLLSPGTIALIAALALGISGFFLSVFLLIRMRRLRRDMKALFAGKEGSDLEEIIRSQQTSISDLDREIQELYGIANRLYELSQESIHKTELLRFNPFEGVGGNHSFTLALLNGKNSGFVISSLHTREGTRIYGKPVENGSGINEFPLTNEEKQVVASAAKKQSDIFTKKN